MAEMIGKVISHYRILEKLGEGGMGVIYKAEDLKLQRPVAVKFLPPELTRDKNSNQRFIREARAASILEHSNICSIYEVNETEEGRMYMVMPCYEGRTLKDMMDAVEQQAAPLSISKIIDITLQIAAGLARAHEAGLVHRDIKPANIMITLRGEVKILDFGLAKLRGQTRMTRNGLTMGTVGYMSPEQARGADVDHRSDLWSLGVVMYEMASGRQPFPGEYDQAVVYSILNEDPQPLIGAKHPVPAELERIIFKCLAKAPENRYSGAEALISDLEQLKESGTIASGGKERFRRRTKLRIMGAVLIGISAVLIGAFFILRGNRGNEGARTGSTETRSKNSITVVYFENLTGDARLNYWRMALCQLLIDSLRQSRYLNVLPGDQLREILKGVGQPDTAGFTASQLREIAREGNSENVLHGSLTRSGNRFRVGFTLQNIGKDVPTISDSVEGIGPDSLFDMVDRIAFKIKSSLNLSSEEIANDVQRKVADISTHSFDAVKFFVEGDQLYEQGKYAESVQAYQQAVSVDPKFALALWKISVNYGYIGVPDQEKVYLRRALALLDRVSVRDQYLLRGYAEANLNNNYEKAIENYQRLLKLYPGDEDGRTVLAVIYRNQEEWDLALEQFLGIARDNPRSVMAIRNVVFIMTAKGRYDLALQLLRSKKELFLKQAPVPYHRELARVLCAQGLFNLAVTETRLAISLEPEDIRNILLLGNIYHLQGNLAAAESEYRRILAKPVADPEKSGVLSLAFLYGQQGKYKKCGIELNRAIQTLRQANSKPAELNMLLAMTYLLLQQKQYADADGVAREAEKAAEELNFLSDRILATHLRGVADAGLGNFAEAESVAARLRERIEKSGNRKRIREWLHLRGVISRAKGQLAPAAADFSEAAGLLSSQLWPSDEHAFYLQDLAAAYYQKGDLDEARRQFEKITNLTWGRLRFGDIYARAFYWLGKIYQRKAIREKAAENYLRFLKIWEKSDPDLAETADAREQLRKLTRRAGP